MLAPILFLLGPILGRLAPILPPLAIGGPGTLHRFGYGEGPARRPPAM